MKRFIIIAAILMAAVSCSHKNGGFTAEEISTIESAGSIMRVLTIEDDRDLSVLRSQSSDLSSEALLSETYERLCSLMVATVTHPSQEGVGIAAPQVGLNRRVVAVQRFDKDPVERNGILDYPFEVYPNIKIVWASDSLAAGPEGCLSVPDRRGDVMRSTEIVIEYARIPSVNSGNPSYNSSNSPGSNGNVPGSSTKGMEVEMVQETISGFTAVIFQHEIDHLDGILYIDRTGGAISKY